MSFVPRTKDNPGDVGRALDQQQSVDNENALYAALLGLAVKPPGMIRQWVSKAGLVDNLATEVFTITTANETGSNDAGVYGVEFQGIVAHGIGPTLETSVIHTRVQFARAINGAGAAGNASAVVESAETAVAASTAATKSIVAVTVTIVEISEYQVSVRFQVDISGTTITTAEVYGMVELIYAGFITPPVIA